MTVIFLGTTHIRAHEREHFHRWFSEENARRTRVVGVVLVFFALINTAAALAQIDQTAWWTYIAYALPITIGVLGIGIVHRREQPDLRLSYVFEFMILATAVIWMLRTIETALPNGGLPEFIIGTLGLALLRFMSPRRAIIVFSGITVAYAVTMWRGNALRFEEILNGAVFATFAVLWASGTYRSKVMEFRNGRLLEELNRQNRGLAALALKDPLTGLPNRRYYDQILQRRWEDPDLQEVPVALLLVDVDHFKQYNDRNGHPQGDLCLQHVARKLEGEAGPQAVCARLGGEEFAVILIGVTTNEATSVAQQIAATVRAAQEVTVSVGVAVGSPAQTSREALYRIADESLYRAKEGGRDRVESGRVSD